MPRAGPIPSTAPAPLLSQSTGVPVSATLAANEVITSRRLRGQPVLPLAFGEAGLPVHPRPRAELAAASGLGGYGPVAGLPALREAAAGYWARRGLPTSPAAVVAGPAANRCCLPCSWLSAPTWPCPARAGSAMRPRPG